MQIGPNFVKSLIEGLSLSMEGEIVLLGKRVIFEVVQKGDCIIINLPFLSEAYMMMPFWEMAIIVSARLYPAKNQLTIAIVFSLPPFPFPFTKTMLSIS